MIELTHPEFLMVVRCFQHVRNLEWLDILEDQKYNFTCKKNAFLFLKSELKKEKHLKPWEQLKGYYIYIYIYIHIFFVRPGRLTFCT